MRRLKQFKEKNTAPQKVSKVGPLLRSWGLAARLKCRTKIKNKKNK